MRLLKLIAVSVLTAACSSSGGAPGSPAPNDRPPPERTIFVDTDGSMLGAAGVLTTRSDDGITRTTYPVPVDSTMKLLLGAYESMGVKVTLLDPAQKRLGNPQFVAAKRMANEPITRIVRCGETITGPRSESDRVVFALVSTVRADGVGKSRVETRLEATAIPIASGNSTGAQVCTTTGLLESRLHTQAATTLRGR